MALNICAIERAEHLGYGTFQQLNLWVIDHLGNLTFWGIEHLGY